MTVDEIMELAEELENAVIYFMARGSGTERIHKANASLRTAIESLAKDAEQWQAYKARRDAVIAAGMGRNILRKEQGEAS